MIDKFTHSPVFPIVPCYDEWGQFHDGYTLKYYEHLKGCGAKIFMTTEGTSQFNGLSRDNIFKLNFILLNNMDVFNDVFIFGIPKGSCYDTRKEIEKHNQYFLSTANGRGDCFYLLKYPERYYNDTTVVNYFHNLADISKFPCLIHCSPLQSGYNGKLIDYTADLINAICEHDNIVGIKEETSDLLAAGFMARDLNKDIGVIFAGGSQMRYEFLWRTHIRSTFLSGVGSIFPQMDLQYSNGDDGDREAALEIEQKLFKVFFKHGWHPSLRYALQYLKIIPPYNREPWPKLSKEARKEIEIVVDDIKVML